MKENRENCKIHCAASIRSTGMVSCVDINQGPTISNRTNRTRAISTTMLRLTEKISFNLSDSPLPIANE